MWFVNLPEPEFTKGKMCTASKTFIRDKVKFFVYKILSLFVLLTMLKIIHEAVDNSKEPHHHHQIPEWLLLVQILVYLHIWLIYLYASFCLDFSTLSTIVTTGGMRTEPGFHNPLLQSRCFTDLWGVQWNLPVHLLLKRTVYIPARKQGFRQS